MSPLQKSYEVQLRPAVPPEELKDSHYPLNSSEQVQQLLPQGHKRYPRSRPFLADTILEKNISIPMRDGIILRADVFRPAQEREKYPAIIPWSPYGKSGTGCLRLDLIPARVGVPYNRLSDYEKFEGPDPAEWVHRGYADVNIDARGSWDSEGNLIFFGSSNGRDIYDAVEFVAKLPWCSGSVCMAGNSWLAISQWEAAAQRPPSLKCIAPFEGASDVYRELVCRGGIPYPAFFKFILDHIAGRHQQEDFEAMLEKHPLMDEYWNDKRVDASRIDIPVYALASYSTMLHLPGSFRAFEDVPHKDKWLRIHATQEWHDLYQENTTNELQQFFDRYAKGIQNGWEQTPHVRASLLGYNRPNIVNHVIASWPPPDVNMLRLFLHGNSSMSVQPAAQSRTLQYDSDAQSLQVDDGNNELSFSYAFPRRTHLLGSAKATLFMSCQHADDLDVFVQLRKADKTEKILESLNIPLKELEAMGMSQDKIPQTNPLKYLGPSGQLRASHRKLDQTLSKPHYAVHEHASEEKIEPGEIVRLEINLWPGGMIFDPGESVVLRIAGHCMVLAEFEVLRGSYSTINKGTHELHISERFQSQLSLPLVLMEG